MKKTLRILAAIMAMLCVISLCACSSGVAPEDLTLKASNHFADEAAVLEYTWTCPLDCTDMMDAIIAEGMEVDGIDTGDAKVIIPLTFTFDGNICTLAYDKDIMADSLEYYIQNFCVWLTDYMYETIIEPTGMSREDADQLFIAQYNMTLSEFVETLMNQSVDIDQIIADIDAPSTAEYYYKYFGNMIIFSAPNDNGICKITFTPDGALKIVDTYGSFAQAFEILDSVSDASHIFYKDWTYTPAYANAI